MYIYFDKNFLKIMNSSVFGKTMEKIRKDRLEITDKTRKYFVSTKQFSKKWLAIETKKKSNKYKPVYLGLPI